MDSSEGLHLNLKEKAERLKYMFDGLNKQKKKYERIQMARVLTQTELEQYNEVSQKLDNFNLMCKNFIRPRKNGVGKFSVEDYISWSQGNTGMMEPPQGEMQNIRGSTSGSESGGDQEGDEQSQTEGPAAGEEVCGEQPQGEWQQTESQTVSNGGNYFDDGMQGYSGGDDTFYSQSGIGVGGDVQQGFGGPYTGPISAEQRFHAPEQYRSGERFYSPCYVQPGDMSYDCAQYPYYSRHPESMKKSPPNMAQGFRGNGFYWGRDEARNHNSRFAQPQPLMFSGGMPMRNDFHYNKMPGRKFQNEQTGGASSMQVGGGITPAEKASPVMMSPSMPYRGGQFMGTPRPAGAMTPGKASYERGGFIPHPGMLLSHGMMPGPPHGSQVMGGSGKSFVPPSMHSQYSGRTGSCMMPSPMINDTGYARGEPGMRSPMMDVFKRSRVDPAASRRTSDVVGYSPTFASPNFGRSERRCYSEGGISYDGRSTSSDNVQLFSFNVEEQSPRLGRGSPPGPQEHNRNFKATPMMFSSDEQGFRSQQRSNQQYGEGPSMPEGEIGPGQDAQEYVPEKANEVAYFLDDMVTFPAEKVKPLNFTPLQTCADANSPHVPRRRGRPPVTSEKKITKDTPIPFSNGSVKQPVQNNTPYKSLNDIVEQDGLSLANNSQMFNPDLKVSTSNHSFEFRSDLSTSKDGFDKAGMEESLFNLDLPCVGDKNEYTHFGKDTTVKNKSEEISTMSPASTSSELGGFIDDRKVKLSRDAKDRLLAYLDVIMHELLTRTCEMVQGKNGGHLTLDDIKTVIVQHGKQGIKGVVPVHGLKYEVNAESQVDGTTAPVKRIDNDNIFKLLDGDQDKL